MLGSSSLLQLSTFPSSKLISVADEFLVHVQETFLDMTLTLVSVSLSRRERAGVRELVRCHHRPLTLTLSQRERG